MTEYDPTFFDINGTEVHIGDTVSWLTDSFGGVETKSAKVTGIQFAQTDDGIKVRVRLQGHTQSMPIEKLTAVDALTLTGMLRRIIADAGGEMDDKGIESAASDIESLFNGSDEPAGGDEPSDDAEPADGGDGE